MSRPLRGFWRRFSHAAVCLGIGASVLAGVRREPTPAMSAVRGRCRSVLGVIMAMLGFLHLPLGRRSALDWLRLLLDGATVAVAGALIFLYVVLDLAPPGTRDDHPGRRRRGRRRAA